MPSEIALPFALAADGSITMETDPDKQIGSHVRSLVGTQLGERVMMGDYGVDTASLLFEPDSSVIQQQLQSNVQHALSQWEPGAILRNVTAIPNEQQDGLASVEVDFIRSEGATTPSQLARHVNTAIIRVGGTVEEEIIG